MKHQLLQFGKYSTSTWDQVPENYLRWLVENATDVRIRSKAQTELVKRFLKGRKS